MREHSAGVTSMSEGAIRNVDPQFGQRPRPPEFARSTGNRRRSAEELSDV
jgi:hypothetical protein